MRRIPIAFGVVALFLIFPATAHAGLINGVGKMAAGLFQLPIGVLQGTLGGPPVIGTLLGAVNGALGTVAWVGSGALETAASAVPVLKSLVPFIPVFT